jgi:hypothetical protein
MHDRTVLTMDEARLVQEAERSGRRAWNQLLERSPSAPFPLRVAPRLAWMPNVASLALTTQIPSDSLNLSVFVEG